MGLLVHCNLNGSLAMTKAMKLSSGTSSAKLTDDIRPKALNGERGSLFRGASRAG